MTLRLQLVNLAWDGIADSSGYDILLDGSKIANTGARARTTKILIPEGAEHLVTIKAQPSGQVQEARFQWAKGKPPPPPPPPPPGGMPLPTTGVISRGDIYQGTFTGELQIQTGEPVFLNYCDLANPNGNLVTSQPGIGLNLTLDHCKGRGGATPQTSGRFVDAYGNVKLLHVKNCEVDFTRGIDCAVSDGVDLLVTRNRHRNVQGLENDGKAGNFIQVRVLEAKVGSEISWNEVLNEYGKSEPTDIISLYYCSNIGVLDNYLQHQSRVGNLTPSSQGGITVDLSDSPGAARAHDVLIARNAVIDGYGIVLYMDTGGDRFDVLENRIIADRLLPNGQTKANGHGSPLTIRTGGTKCNAIGNVVGYIDAGGQYISEAVLASYLSGAEGGGTAAAAKNTVLPQSEITAAAEQAEWTRWQQKLAAAGVTVGA